MEKTLEWTPSVAMGVLRGAVSPVGLEVVSLGGAVGRVLGGAVPVLDRGSPACDVSAMDGYAVRLGDLARGGEVVVSGVSVPGRAAPALVEGRGVQVFTGAAVPVGAEVVIQREMTEEFPGGFRFRGDLGGVVLGQHIRRAGENGVLGAVLGEKGRVVTPVMVGAWAAAGVVEVVVRRRVRVGILTTGDEVRPVGATGLAPWEIRDSNGPLLAGMVGGWGWCEVVEVGHVGDSLEAVGGELRRLMGVCDAVFLTGGVSMGDFDFVPGALKAVGGRVLFHRVPIRPGRPLLAGVWGEVERSLEGGERSSWGDGREDMGAGRPHHLQRGIVLGLPGNPLSVAVTGRRFGVEALGGVAGIRGSVLRGGKVRLVGGDGKKLGLWWYRPVVVGEDGTAVLVDPKSSGDLLGPLGSTGFVEVPPGTGCEEGVSLDYFPW